MFEVFHGEPDFVNPEGTKWWKAKTITDYAQKEDKHGTTLNLHGYGIELADGTRSYVLVDHKQVRVVYETQSLEQVGIHIDVLKLLERDK